MKKRREWVGTISQRRRKILAMKMRTTKLLLKKHTKNTWHSGFVKVNMDGLPIGRKVDLNAHDCYENLAHAFEVMLLKTSSSGTSIRRGKQHHSQLLDGSSEFVLTYEDREGDWMLVGDVPWRYNSNIFHL